MLSVSTSEINKKSEVKKCQEEIKQAHPDKVLKPEEGKAAVTAVKDRVPAAAQAKVEIKVEAKVEDKVKAADKVKAGDKVKAEIAKKEENIMPGFDRSGPQGAGPMTGGARGFCNPAAGDFQPPYGRGFGYGAQRGGRLGLGRGFRGYRGRGWQSAGGDAGYPQTDAPVSTSENMNIFSELKQGVDTLNQLLTELKDHLKTPQG